MIPSFDEIEAIDGWFDHVDYVLFNAILAAQQESTVGDIVEVGPYFGRCSAVLGGWLREGETLKVVDLFGIPATELENAAEVAWNAYGSLSLAGFVKNYSGFHESLPEITHGESVELLQALGAASVRFAHIDGSHAYPNVVRDLQSTIPALTADGVIVIDDFRTEHAPGVAAAAWWLVASGQLVPFALSPQKLYASTSDRPDMSEFIIEASEANGYQVTLHSVTPGQQLIPRVSGRPSKSASPDRAKGTRAALLRRSARRLLRAVTARPT